MGVVTVEGIVEDGQIHLKEGVRLLDGTKVCVIVPEAEKKPLGRIVSPWLVHPEEIGDFRMEVINERPDAGA
jgi:hypothetical protein